MVRWVVYLNALLLACGLAAVPVRGEVHKRLDEHGQVHYEDSAGGSGGIRPSSAVSGQERPALTPEQERLQRQRRVLEALESERRSKQQAKAKAEQERKEAAAKCESAKQELVRRENARYLYRKGKDGEREVLSDEARATATAEVEAAIKKWCK